MLVQWQRHYILKKTSTTHNSGPLPGHSEKRFAFLALPIWVDASTCTFIKMVRKGPQRCLVLGISSLYLPASPSTLGQHVILQIITCLIPSTHVFCVMKGIFPNFEKRIQLEEE
jgi:hypothetical protein